MGSSRFAKIAGPWWVAVFLIPAFLAAEPTPPMRLAVADFTPVGVTAQEALLASDLLRNALVESGAYELVDRKHLAKILKEQALQASGLLDEKTAVQTGRLLGAQYLVQGTLQRSASVWFLLAEVIHVETGRVEKSARDRFPDGAGLGEAARKVANDITGVTLKKTVGVYVKKGHGLLQVKSTPSKAQVTLNGAPWGETEFFQQVPEGSHRLRLSLPGHLPVEVVEVVKAGETREVNVALVRGIGPEEMRALHDRHREGAVRNGILSLVSFGLMGGALALGDSQNLLGDQRYGEYLSAVAPDPIRVARTQYQEAYNAADVWYGVAEGSLILGAFFTVQFVIDLVQTRAYGQRLKSMGDTGVRPVFYGTPTAFHLGLVRTF